MSEFKGLFEPKKANEPYEFYLERLQDDVEGYMIYVYLSLKNLCI